MAARAPTAAADAAGGAAAADAALVPALLALDPGGLAGAVLHGPPGPQRDAWLARLRACLPPHTPWRRLPPGASPTVLDPGLDLAATLRAGTPVTTAGLLGAAAGGALLVPMAERLDPAVGARLAAMLDGPPAARCLVLAFDEALPDEAPPPVALLDRVALHIVCPPVLDDPLPPPAAIEAARRRLPHVTCPDALLEALTGTAAALGIASPRPPLSAVRLARAAAALAGRAAVTEADAALAARLVLAPRALQLPADAEAEPPPPEPPAETEGEPPPEHAPGAQAPGEQVLAAARAAIPAGLLALLQAGGPSRPKASARGGAARSPGRRGRPVGVRPGDPRAGGRLALLETLTAAAPWQRLRRAETPAPPDRILVRPEDLRVRRHRSRAESTVCFAVDASGSQAAARLAEAKGAVELLLADCYVRRDRVALIAFRGTAAELVLPPTASLVRAKRGLAGLPGGGGTPLAAGLDAALALAATVRRGGRTPLLVLLTDGRANVARDGAGGRARAGEDALTAARAWRAAAHSALLVDTGTRPSEAAARIADAMAARYLAMPQVDAGGLSRAVRAAGAAG